MRRRTRPRGGGAGADAMAGGHRQHGDREEASDPGHGESHRSAWVAVLDIRVSKTMSFAPAIFPSMIRCAWGLK